MDLELSQGEECGPMDQLCRHPETSGVLPASRSAVVVSNMIKFHREQLVINQAMIQRLQLMLAQATTLRTVIETALCNLKSSRSSVPPPPPPPPTSSSSPTLPLPHSLAAADQSPRGRAVAGGGAAVSGALPGLARSGGRPCRTDCTATLTTSDAVAMLSALADARQPRQQLMSPGHLPGDVGSPGGSIGEVAGLLQADSGCTGPGLLDDDPATIRSPPAGSPAFGVDAAAGVLPLLQPPQPLQQPEVSANAAQLSARKRVSGGGRKPTTSLPCWPVLPALVPMPPAPPLMSSPEICGLGLQGQLLQLQQEVVKRLASSPTSCRPELQDGRADHQLQFAQPLPGPGPRPPKRTAATAAVTEPPAANVPWGAPTGLAAVMTTTGRPDATSFGGGGGGWGGGGLGSGGGCPALSAGLSVSAMAAALTAGRKRGAPEPPLFPSAAAGSGHMLLGYADTARKPQRRWS